MHTRAPTHQEHTTGAIARAVQGELVGDASLTIRTLDTMERAGAGALTFIRAPRYAQAWATSRASCALITRDLAPLAHDPSQPAPPGRALILVPDADLALVTILHLFAPPSPASEPGTHASSTVSPGARVSPLAIIGPGCIIEDGASIEDGARLIAHCYIGHAARIGKDTTLHPGVKVLDRCVVGDHCILHAGVVLGADGFGYRPSENKKGVVKVPHIGNVVLGNHVEVGANSCIDRAKFSSTTIGDGTKIDNLVQIAHNCTVGRSCLLCGCSALAGSVTLGDGVIIAGGAAIADNLTVGDGARIAGYAAISTDVPPGAEYAGIPGRPAHEWRRGFAMLRTLAKRQRGTPPPL